MADGIVQISCFDCSALNRVPVARVGDRPVCGRCHRALFRGQPVALSGATFDGALRGELPLLVDFWAPWCGPCRMMAPQFEAAARVLEPRVRLAKIDTEAEPALGARFNVRSIPTLALFSGGREVARQAGAMSAPQITAWVDSQLRR